MKNKINYKVRYISKENIAPALGFIDIEINDFAGNGIQLAFIRNDLPPKIKYFVFEHELYHIKDKHTWGGWIFRELRTNVITGLKDPIGIFSTYKCIFVVLLKTSLMIKLNSLHLHTEDLPLPSEPGLEKVSVVPLFLFYTHSSRKPKPNTNALYAFWVF